MAVRKLAPEDMQPESFVLSPETESFADKEIAKYPPGRQASAVIALLTKAQEQAGGWLPRKAIEAVAAKLDMPAIRVMEVVTFYTMFNLEPVGKYFIQFCGTTPCVLRGAGDIRRVLERRIGDQNHVTPDGTFSWLEVECLGACSNAPMVQINDDYYEDLTTENFETLLDDLAAGRPVKVGSQIGRIRSEPFEAVNTLQDPALYDGSVVGAWRKRFEEQAKAETGEAAAAVASVPQEAKAAKPASGRATRERCCRYPGQARQGRRAADQPDRPEGSCRSVQGDQGRAEGCRRAAGSPERQVLCGDTEEGRRGGACQPDDARGRYAACASRNPPRRQRKQAGRDGRQRQQVVLME